MSDYLPISDFADQLHDDLLVKRLTDSDNTGFSNDLEKGARVDEVAKTASGGFFYSLVRWPHSQMLRIWLIFIFGSFAVSILKLTYVQTRIWKKQAWSTF